MAKDTTTEHPCFFCWLAGFIDGEGCFYIGREHVGSHRAVFRLSVRIDEKPMLDEIVRRTGIGYVTSGQPSPRTRATHPGTRAHATWHVTRKQDCAKLAQLLQEHPQYAKKRRDFEIWLRALRCWQTKRSGNAPPNDWTDMARLKLELEAVRSVDLDGYEPIPEASEAEHQLSFPSRVADPA